MTVIDIEQPADLWQYLTIAGYIDTDIMPQMSVLQGGVSNRTVLVELPTGERWVLKQALEKLRVSVDWFSNPLRIHREALGLRWLKSLAPVGTVPEFLFEDESQHILAMSAVPRPHRNWKFMLLGGFIQTDHIQQFANLLASIHRKAFLRRDEMALLFEDSSFFESLRLEPYYRYTASQVLQAADFLAALIQETQVTRLTLVHGDYSPKNILVHQNRLVLLDHEVIHWGDPAFDLGFSLTHFLSKAGHLPAHRQTFADAAQHYWTIYRESLGDVDWRDLLEARVVRHTLGCLLARVDGRSPLEYLSLQEQECQRQVVLQLMFQPPTTIPDLTDAFLGGLT
jgi:fructosamine-3-kinase